MSERSNVLPFRPKDEPQSAQPINSAAVGFFLGLMFAADAAERLLRVPETPSKHKPQAKA